MAELYDVTLGGMGYMVAPKSYRRGMDAPGLVGSPPVRVVQDDFGGGGLDASGKARDRVAYSLNMLPAEDGRSARPGPKAMSTAAFGSLAAGQRRYSVMVGGRPYVGSG